MTSNLKYGLATPNVGEIFSSVQELVEMAILAEESGWDGFFIWDIILSSRDPVLPVIDPWITLTAVAAKTEKLIIGTTVTPLPRRRPWRVARETVSLDHFSNGRLILGVGLGYDPEVEFGAFGEETNSRIRAKKLDESLEILQKLWSGKPFSYKGEHYEIKDVSFKPEPLQTPRIPIWGAGSWPNKKPFMRAANLDGVIPFNNETMYPEVNEMKEIIEFISEYRDVKTNFDIVAYGKTSGIDIEKSKEIIREFANIGITWWTEDINLKTKEEVLKRIQAGPPRI
ncbi:MAG: LLM class flavin-dependent oxidoreductase [Candidatus Heimdallarchaeaceae archaeon]